MMQKRNFHVFVHKLHVESYGHLSSEVKCIK